MHGGYLSMTIDSRYVKRLGGIINKEIKMMMVVGTFLTEVLVQLKMRLNFVWHIFLQEDLQ